MVILSQGTSYNRKFKMISSADHLSSGTVSNPIVKIAKAGTGFTNPGNTVVEQSLGWYQILLNGTDTDTIGDLAYNITGTLCDDTDFVDQIVVVSMNNYPGNNINPIFIQGGTVGSVTTPMMVSGGTVGKVTGTVAILTSNVDKTGYSLSSPQTIDITGNITGNLSGSVNSVTTPVFVQGGTIGRITGIILVSGGTIGSLGGGSVVVSGGTIGSVTGGTLIVSGGTIGSLTGSISSVTTVTGNVNGSVNNVVVPVFVQGGTIGSLSGGVVIVSGGTIGSLGGGSVIVSGGTIGAITGSISSVGSVTGSVNSVVVPVFVQGGTIGSVTSLNQSGIVNAVWNELRTDHVTNNTFGQGVFVVGGTVSASLPSVIFVSGGTVGKVTNTVATLTSNADKAGYSLSDPQTFSVTGNVTGNLSGSVGSVTGAVGSVTTPVFVQGGTVGKVTGTVAILTSNNDKTGYSLSSPQTIDITGNITGNLSGSVGSVTGSVGSVTTPVFVQGGTIGKVTTSTQTVLNYVTVGTNNDKTGYSLSAGQLFVKKNTALANFMFPMIDSADHFTLKTGLTVAGQVSIDAAAFGNLTNSVTELSSGVYAVNLAAADVNGTNIMLKFTAVGADTRLIEIITQA